MSTPSIETESPVAAQANNQPLWLIYPVSYGEDGSHTVKMASNAAGDDASSDILSAAMDQIKKGGGGRGGGGGGSGGLAQGPYTCGCGELKEYKILSAVFGGILALGIVVVAAFYIIAWLDTVMRARHRRQRLRRARAQVQPDGGLPLQNMPVRPPPSASLGTRGIL